MAKQAAAVIAFVVVYLATLFVSARVGKGDSTEPNHILLQTREEYREHLCLFNNYEWLACCDFGLDSLLKGSPTRSGESLTGKVW
jgi:hypothetical protein